MLRAGRQERRVVEEAGQVKEKPRRVPACDLVAHDRQMMKRPAIWSPRMRPGGCAATLNLPPVPIKPYFARSGGQKQTPQAHHPPKNPSKPLEMPIVTFHDPHFSAEMPVMKTHDPHCREEMSVVKIHDSRCRAAMALVNFHRPCFRQAMGIVKTHDAHDDAATRLVKIHDGHCDVSPTALRDNPNCG